MKFSVVDVEFKKEGQDKILRVYIDKDGGVDLDDCEKFSRALEAVLDEKDFIEEAYKRVSTLYRKEGRCKTL